VSGFRVLRHAGLGGASPSSTGRTKISLLLATAVLASLFLASTPAQAVTSTREISSAGPLTRIIISDDLNCQVSHAGDASFEFYGGQIGACATLAAVGGTLFGPAGIPAGGGAGPRTAFTPMSQSGVLGTGTNSNPFRVTTLVGLGSTGLRISETDSYVVGQESYRTDVQVLNMGAATLPVTLFRAGDCYLQNSDYGYGFVNASIKSAGCSVNPNNSPASRIEQWIPISGGNNFFEASYNQVWSHIGTQAPFPDTCRCTEFIDNGAGLSWQFAVTPSVPVTRSHLTTFSPAGEQPLSTTKTADSPTSIAGDINGYAITVTNPNPTPATLTSISDTLPSGFSYRPGTTAGVVGIDPAVSGQTLTWNGPHTVPAFGSVLLHFGVNVSTIPGQYFNNAGAVGASDITVAPTGDTAPITVTRGNTVSGGAFGEQVAVTPGGLPVSSGPMPSVTLPSGGGGPFTASLPSVNSPGQLTAGASTATTEGSIALSGPFAKSSADIATANIGAGTILLEGVHTECISTSTKSVGSTRVDGLVVNGQAVPDQTPAPNTVMAVPGYGTLVLNEQAGIDQASDSNPYSPQLGATSLTVNAFHLKLAPESPIGAGEIILAQSRCGLDGPSVRIGQTGSVGPVIPTLSINDTSVNEGSGTPYALAQFQVTLSQASTQTVFVRFSASDGTATAADGDFVPSTGSTLSFQPGDPLTKTISIKVVNDKKPEPTETFSVRLTMPVNATIARGTGFATIIDDDPPAAL